MNVDAMIDSMAHELSHVLTDPEATGWWGEDANKDKVGVPDKCNFQYGDTMTMGPTGPTGTSGARFNMTLGTRQYLVQQNFVNVGLGYGYCSVRVENDDAEVTAFTTDLPQPPAGSPFVPMVIGKEYHAQVTYRNTGDTPWLVGGTNSEVYSLGSQSPEDNDYFGTGGRITLPPATTVAPGATHTFSFPFRWIFGPVYLNLNFQWRMVREAVRWFGQSTPLVPVIPGINSAFVDVSSTRDIFVGAGKSTEIRVAFYNPSGLAWRAADGYALVLESPSLWGATRIDLAPGEEIQPGQVKAFVFNIHAPSSVGDYPMQWRLSQDGVGPFGDAFTRTVHVVPVNHAQFVSQSVPSTMHVYKNSKVHVRMRNDGTKTWTSGYRLDVNGAFSRVSAVPLPVGTSVPPGGEWEFEAVVTPSLWPTYPTNTLISFNLQDDGGQFFPALTPDTEVTVDYPLIDQARCFDRNVPASIGVDQKATISYTMQNVGTTTWTSDYMLAALPPDLESAWGVDEVPVVGAVPPDGTYSFTFEITAPPTPGSYSIAYSMFTTDPREYFADFCGDTIEVVGNDHVRFDSVAVPQTMNPLYEYAGSVTVTNDGSTTWPSTYALHVVPGHFEFSTGFNPPVGRPIAPGESTTIPFFIRSKLDFPSYPATGTLQFYLATGAGTAIPNSSSSLLISVIDPSIDYAQCADHSVPTQMRVNDTATVYFTMRNSGTTTWTPSYRFASLPPDLPSIWKIDSIPVPFNVAPGQEHTFVFDIVAPPTPDIYTVFYMVFRGAGNFDYFFDACAYEIQVTP